MVYIYKQMVVPREQRYVLGCFFGNVDAFKVAVYSRISPSIRLEYRYESLPSRPKKKKKNIDIKESTLSVVDNLKENLSFSLLLSLLAMKQELELPFVFLLRKLYFISMEKINQDSCQNKEFKWSPYMFNKSHSQQKSRTFLN